MIKLRKLSKTSEKKFKELCKKDSFINISINDFELEDLDLSIEIDENKKFDDKYILAEYLYEKLKDIKEVNTQIWHFLVIVYYKQLLKNNKIGEIYRFFIDDKNSYYHSYYPARHLLKPVFDLYNLYNDNPGLIKFLLNNPVNESGQCFLEIIKRQDIMKNKNFIEVSNKIFSKDNSKLKSGSVNGVFKTYNIILSI